MTSAYDANDKLVNYYGVLQNIIEYTFGGDKELVVAFFQCDWFDPRNGMRVDDFGMVEVKHSSRLQGHDNIVLAHQAEQVYYLSYPHPSLRAWWVAFKVNPHVFPPGDDAYMEKEPGDDDNNVFQEASQTDEDEPNAIGQQFHVDAGEDLELVGNNEIELMEEPRPKWKRAPVRKSIRIQRLQESVIRQRVNEAESDADDF